MKNVAQLLLERFMALVFQGPSGRPKRSALFPYSSKRQLGIVGVNHPSIELPRRPRNPCDFSGACWQRGRA